jgi:hypothetical protein
MHRVKLRPLATLVLAAFLWQSCGAPTSTSVPSTSALAPGASPPSAAPVTGGSGSVVPSHAPDTVDAHPSGGPSLSGQAYVGMPISLEMTVECGLCGPAYWLWELPRFRLYADGTAVYRGGGEDTSTAPYRFVQLGDKDFEDLLAFALDDGGLRGAEPQYFGNGDDAGSTRLALHAGFMDEAASVDVVIEPLSGSGSTDRFGNPIRDLARRERLEALAVTLSDFDGWLASRGDAGEPFAPEAYAAAILDQRGGEGEAPWPWGDVAPDDFGSAGDSVSLARISPAQAAAAGVGPGGGDLSIVPFADGLAGSLLVRPLLPGDDRPGMFGLRPDTVAMTVEPELRVRSLPEVSDASARLSPLLRNGDALYVISGPVAGSGYDWYEIHAPRANLTGWVAAAAKTGEDWIRPVPLGCTMGASPDPIVDAIGYELMHLACYGELELSGMRFLGRPEGDGIRCPDTFEWLLEPEWLDMPLVCGYEFRQEEPDSGSADVITPGILHPSIVDVPRALLAAQPGGLLVDVTGRLDHPDSRECTAVGSNAPPPALVRLQCRMRFVITARRPAQ